MLTYAEMESQVYSQAHATVLPFEAKKAAIGFCCQILHTESKKMKMFLGAQCYSPSSRLLCRILWTLLNFIP